MTLRPEVEADLLEAERQKARFLLAAHGAITPDQYDHLTLAQLGVWIEVLNERK